MEAEEAPWPRFRRAGDQGLLVEFGDSLAPQIGNAVLAFDADLAERPIAGVTERVPTLRSLLLRYDPLDLAPAKLRAQLEERLSVTDWYQAPPPAGRKLWRLPAVYGGDAGPDLPQVADLLGLGEAAAIEAHARCRQRVLMLGFSPGCAYCGPLPPEWDLPRLEQIKPLVPAGSLSVAVCQTVLFPTAMPTGWRTIARTPFLNFRPAAAEPVLLRAGDELSFEPITEAEAARLSEADMARSEPIP